MSSFSPLPHPEQPESSSNKNEDPSVTGQLARIQRNIDPQANQLTVMVDTSAADYYLKQGNQHYKVFLTRQKSGDLTLAIQCFRHALESNPRLVEGYVKLASALFDKGEISPEAAIQYCQTALSIQSDYSDAHLYLGYFLKQSGQPYAALEAFKHAVENAAWNNARCRMAYGRLQLELLSMQNDHPQDLTSFLKRASGMSKGLGQLFLGFTLLPSDKQAFGDFKDAVYSDTQIYSLIGLSKMTAKLGLASASRWLLKLGSQKMPDESIFFHLLGDAYYRTEQSDTAIYYYNRALEHGKQQPDLYRKLGELYLDFSDAAKAMETYQALLQLQPGDFEATYQLAKIYTDQGNFMRALYYFKEIAQLETKNPYIHSNMAYVLFKLEDYDGAIQEYKLAVQYGDDPIWTATVAQTLGTLYYQAKHNIEAAIDMFQLAYQLDNQNLDCVAQLADLYVDQGQYDSAISAYQYILDFDPKNADCHNTIGYLLWQLDKNDEAVVSYQKAITHNPDSHIAYNNLGVIYLDEYCQPQKALNMFKTAIDLQPDYTLACFNLGRALEAIGKTTESAKQYSQALALNAATPKKSQEIDSDDIHSRLDSLFKVS